MVFDILKAVRPSLRSNTMFPAPRLIVYDGKSRNPRVMEVKGRNILTGLPKTIKLTSEEIRVALKDATNQIVEIVHGVLEKTPPELAADIVDRGIVLAGGGAMLSGMDTLIEQRTGVNTLTVQNAVNVVAVGTGKYAEIMARMEE